MASKELNLIPESAMLRLAVRRRVRRWARVLVFALLAAGASRLALRPLLNADRARLREATRRADEHRRAAGVVDSLRTERDRLAAIIIERNSVLPDATLLDLFRALETAMPSRLYLRSLSAAPAEGAKTATEFDVQLEGAAPGTDLVAAFLFRLAGRSDMSATELESSHRAEGDAAGGVEFAVKLRYHPGRASGGAT